jgi:hypothetical protein
MAVAVGNGLTVCSLVFPVLNLPTLLFGLYLGVTHNDGRLVLLHPRNRV